MRESIVALAISTFVLAACGGNDAERLTATGTLEATESTVSAQVSGLIRELRVQEGAPVQKGDTLALIDATDWLYQLEQAESNLRAMEASFQLALEGARKEDILQAEAQYTSARNDLKRMEELYQSHSIAEKQLEDARTRFTLADQTLKKLREGSRQEERSLARARRDQAAAATAQLRKKVSDCAITAPLDGIVVNRFVEIGELAGPGAAIVRIADLAQLKINVYVPETVIPRIQLGQQVELTVDAFEERTFSGKVIYISPTAEFTPKNIQTKEERVKLVFAVKIVVENTGHVLKAGLPADVVIQLTGGQP